MTGDRAIDGEGEHHPDPEIDFMETHHTWCSTCGDYFGNKLYELEHADHDQ